MSDSHSDPDTIRSSDPPNIAEEDATDMSDRISVINNFYRGEMERSVGWRTRLDQTTNWAVVIMAAILTFTFSSSDNPHYVVLIGVLGVLAFLIIESQRYQEYDAWRYRVRVMQRQFVADMIDSESSSRSNWRNELADDLRDPTLVIPRWRAIGHRLKRVYLFLLSVLIFAWLLRISVFDSEQTWLQTASIADIPGSVVVGIVATLYLIAVVLALLSAFGDKMREFSDDPISD
jgi:uncharacterized membrane protein